MKRTEKDASGLRPGSWGGHPGHVLVSLLVFMAGCGGATDSMQPAPTPGKVLETTGALPRTVTDSLKRNVTLAQPPARIVSLAPKNTEILFAIGAGDRVVGVTSYCTYPLEARRREEIGGFSSQSISLEKIIALRPDLVVSDGEIHAPIIAELDRLDIPVLALAAESFDELFHEMQLVASLTGHEQTSAALVADMQRRIRLVMEASQAIALEDRVTVFYQVWDDPLSAASPASFLGRLIETCGGVNIVADSSTRYPQISQEVLLARNPDVILAPTTASAPVTVESLRARPGWRDLKAVRAHRVHLIDGDLVSRCGPRLVDALEIMAQALYPDRFRKASAKKPEASTPAAEVPP